MTFKLSGRVVCQGWRWLLALAVSATFVISVIQTIRGEAYQRRNPMARRVCLIQGSTARSTTSFRVASALALAACTFSPRKGGAGKDAG